MYQIAVVRSVVQMPPILTERRKKLATFVLQAEASLMASLGRAGPGVRPGQRGRHIPFILVLISARIELIFFLVAGTVLFRI